MKLRHLPAFLLFIAVATLSADVRINEFLTSNAKGLTTAADEDEDWIEIYNDGPETVDLEGYYLTDDAFSPDDPESHWRFPQVTLASDAYLIVFASGTGESTLTELHANFKLSSNGERLALIAQDGMTILTDFTPAYPEQKSNTSYGYVNNGSQQFMAQPTPGAKNRPGVTGFVEDVIFSVKHGFYEAPITIELTTETEGAEIVYTTDDRVPDEGTIFTGQVGETYTGPFEISKTTVVRALAKKAGMQDSVLRTQTYLFLDDILKQPAQPEGFPARWGTRKPDYEMDPEVVGGIYTEEEVKSALRSAPTISLVTENDNLFASNGIYTNSLAKDLINDGADDKWERPVSVEFFDFPHGQTVQANAAIRMQGNASRNPDRVKHNMRIIFRTVYGPGKLNFRLFEDSEVETFNSINLRSNNGDSWINPGVRTRAQYIRDQWHRVVQRIMRQPNQSQIYAHLYINGLYWGMYHVFERFEASLLSEHYGGGVDDWDALQDTPAFQDIVVNGDDVAFLRTHDLAKGDLTQPETYQELLEYVDVDNQIDYLLMNFYSGNQDWDHKNMRYARRRTPMDGAIGNGWVYFAWDSERAGLNGLSSQVLTTDNTTKKTALGPSALNAQMHENPDYHLRFADRVVKYCFNNGVLTPEAAAASWKILTDEVYEPLIGESARWGDLHVSRPETREGNWQTQLDKENNVWFPGRTNVLLDQLARRKFIPSKISFPQFEPFGGVVEEGTTIPMSIFNSTIFNQIKGDIYYTMDGSDPRQPDGTLHPDAITFDPKALPVISHTLTMMGRVYDSEGDWWSPLGEALFHLAELPTKYSLTISEIHYAPATPETSDLEYIELTNTSDKAIDLSGVQITNGVDAVIDDTIKATLAPGAYAVIVSDREAFEKRYPDVDPKLIVSEFANSSNLDNNGERLTLRDRTGLLLHTLRYNDKAPWPTWENNEGRSLTFIGEVSPSIAHPENWIAGPVGGSPGAANQFRPPSDGALATWLSARGLTDALTAVGPDQQPALLYYVFGIDDFARTTDGLLTLQPNDSVLSITYPRRANLSGIVWTLESSNDLKTWTATPGETLITGTKNGLEIISGSLPNESSYWRMRISAQ